MDIMILMIMMTWLKKGISLCSPLFLRENFPEWLLGIATSLIHWEKLFNLEGYSYEITKGYLNEGRGSKHFLSFLEGSRQHSNHDISFAQHSLIYSIFRGVLTLNVACQGNKSMEKKQRDQ